MEHEVFLRKALFNLICTLFSEVPKMPTDPTFQIILKTRIIYGFVYFLDVAGQQRTEQKSNYFANDLEPLFTGFSIITVEIV